MMQALVDEYLAGPAALEKAIGGMTPEEIDAAPLKYYWSTRQVICHLADFEPVYVDRMTRILSEERPLYFGADPDRFARKLAYEQRDLRVELDLIRIVRQHMGGILRTFPDEALGRIGVHSELRDQSLESLLRAITDHIPHHIEFIQSKRAALRRLQKAQQGGENA